jgi:hypothetical protein
MKVSKQARIGQILILIGTLAILPFFLLSFTTPKGYGIIFFLPTIFLLVMGLVSFNNTLKNNYKRAGILGVSGLLALIFLNPFMFLGSLFCLISPEAKLNNRILRIILMILICLSVLLIIIASLIFDYNSFLADWIS